MSRLTFVNLRLMGVPLVCKFCDHWIRENPNPSSPFDGYCRLHQCETLPRKRPCENFFFSFDDALYKKDNVGSGMKRKSGV